MTSRSYDAFYQGKTSYVARTAAGSWGGDCGGELGWGGAYTTAIKETSATYAATEFGKDVTKQKVPKGITVLKTQITDEMKQLVGVPIGEGLAWCGEANPKYTPKERVQFMQCMSRLQGAYDFFWLGGDTLAGGKPAQIKFNNRGLRIDIPYSVAWADNTAGAYNNAWDIADGTRPVPFF